MSPQSDSQDTLVSPERYKRFVDTPVNSCSEEVAIHCAEELSLEEGALEYGINSLAIFLREMYAIRRIKSLAILATQTQHYPRLLTFVIHMPIELESEGYLEDSRAVSDAESILVSRGESYIRPTLYFVNGAQLESESLEPLVTERWSKDLDEEPLAFIEFQRN